MIPTREQIIRMMREAGLDQYGPDTDCREPYWIAIFSEIEAFAALVAAAEREACAKLLESRMTGANELMDAVRSMEAYAIRARGQ